MAAERRTPASKFAGLAALIGGGAGGNERGARGLLYGLDKAGFNGLNWPELRGEDSAEEDAVGSDLGKKIGDVVMTSSFPFSFYFSDFLFQILI